MAQADIQASPSPPPPSQAESVAVSVCQLIGAVLFSCGSACFVRMAWVDDWVLPWRVGCVLWIGGCVPYLWPPLQQYLWPSPKQGALGSVDHASNACQVGAMLSWTAGSAFAFYDNLDTAVLVTNGSACLLCDALLQARQLRSAALSARKQIALLTDLLVGVFYVIAGALGGYTTEVGLLRFGNCCWLVASLLSCARPCLAFSVADCRARQGRAAYSSPESSTCNKSIVH